MLAWLPVALWMILLFGASTDLGAPRQTSRFLVPLLRWLAPEISNACLERAQYAVRKTGHAVGYAVLAVLTWRARRRSRPEGDSSCRLRDAEFSLMLAVAYACSDEWPQSFTASRNGSLADVVLDATGAAAGLALIWIWEHRRRRPW